MNKFQILTRAESESKAVYFADYDPSKHSIPEDELEQLKEFPTSAYAFSVVMPEGEGQCYRKYADGTLELCPTPFEWMKLAKRGRPKKIKVV